MGFMKVGRRSLEAANVSGNCARIAALLRRLHRSIGPGRTLGGDFVQHDPMYQAD